MCKKIIYLLIVFILFLSIKISAQDLEDFNKEGNFIFEEYQFLSLLGLNYDENYKNYKDTIVLINPLFLSEIYRYNYDNLQQVLILKGKDNEVVDLFIKGFLSQYDINKVIILNVKQVRDYDMDNFPVVIALTSEAANFMKNNYNSKALNIYSLVLSPEYLGIESKFIGFSVYPSIKKVAAEIKKLFPSYKSIGLVYSIGSYNISDYKKDIENLNLNFVPINVNNYNIDKIEDKIKKCDVVFIMPDIFTLEEENLFKIIYNAKKNNKVIISTHKVLLNYGVDIVFSVDYKELGVEVSNFVKSYFINKNVNIKNYTFFTDKLIIFTSKNYKL